MQSSDGPSMLHALLAGAAAGMAVDITLFPLDTIKTRLQSKAGFRASGGFKNIYAGLGSTALGSAPSAAAFFVTYETFKALLSRAPLGPDAPEISPLVHMASASAAEVAACIVRVPTEIIKQRLQARIHTSIAEAATSIYRTGGILGFYRGYTMTVFREFPLYESLKYRLSRWLDRPLWSPEAAACGCVAGGVAAAVTTPLDVIKTRIMLSVKAGKIPTIVGTAASILREEGPSAFLRGIGPRVMWISIGGSIFLGVYEAAKSALSGYNHHSGTASTARTANNNL